MNHTTHDEAVWRDADLVLDRLLDLPDAERDAHFAALELSADVRERAARLLAAHRQAGGVLERPLPLPPAPEAMRGRRLGRWIIEDEIGRGGMAVVFRARSAAEPVGQVAALKLLTLGALAGDGLRRFREEQQLLARLRHPHIAALVDSGMSDEGTPWFAMTLVDGQRIDAWCQTRQLGMPARVRLLLDVCAAVDHAHRNLIIHRDLKPSNVLVDDGGHVHLLDFGIARLAQAGESTQTHKRALTPQYAAPEQFRGAAASTAMDVYGLGALLYAMLTGAPPRDVSTEPDATPTLPSQAIGRVEALAAAELARARREVRGDLDAVILRALASDVEQRYPGVAALAADLNRWLLGQPVEARVPSWTYRTLKFVRRHRIGVAASATIVLALAAGVVGTLWQAAHARDEARRALAEAERADAVRDFLLDLFSASDPEHNGGNAPDLFAILANGAARAQKPEALPLHARAELLAALGAIYRNLGRLKESETLLDQAIALYAGDRGTPSPDRYAPALSRIPLLTSLGRSHEAVEAARKLLAQIRADPDAPPVALATALMRINDARLFAGVGDDPAAIGDALESVAMARLEVPPEPESLANKLHTLAMIQRNQENLAGSEAAAREAVTIFESLAPLGRNGLRAAVVTLAQTLSEQQRHDEALVLFERGVAITRSLYAADHVFVARTLNSYASELLAVGRFDDAQAALNESLAIQRKAQPNNPRLAPVLFNLAWLKEAQGDYVAAKAALTEALALQQQDQNDERLTQINASLAHVHAALGESESARMLFDDVEHVLEQMSGGLQTRVRIKTALRLAEFRLDDAQPERVAVWLAKMRPALQRSQRAMDPLGIEAALLDAQVAHALGRQDEFSAAWRRTLDQLRGIQPALRYFAYEHYLTAARFALSLGDTGTAAELFKLGEGSLTAQHAALPRLAARRAELLATLTK